MKSGTLFYWKNVLKLGYGGLSDNIGINQTTPLNNTSLYQGNNQELLSNIITGNKFRNIPPGINISEMQPVPIICSMKRTIDISTTMNVEDDEIGEKKTKLKNILNLFV